MKIAAIGDIHNRRKWEVFWKLIALYDKVVFVGDYFDSYPGPLHIPNKEGLKNLREIIRFKKAFPDKVVLLLGNHDYSYINPTMYRCSGFDSHIMIEAANLFEDNKDLFTNCIELDGYLFSHAGVSLKWLARYNEHVQNLALDEQVNAIIANKTTSIAFHNNMGRHMDLSGNCITQSPIWIRPSSLIHVMAHPLQVVGHTQQETPRKVTHNENTLILCDSPDYYTILDNGNFSYKPFKNDTTTRSS